MTTGQHPLVERYVSQLGANLGHMPPGDQREVLQEIRTHIEDAVAAGRPLDAVLEALGPADALARAYNVELLLHPREPARKSARTERYFALIGLVAIGSIPTLVITVTLGAIGVSFLISGLVMFIAGVMDLAGTLPEWVQLEVPPIVVLVSGPIMAAVGAASLLGLIGYIKLAARTIQRVLPART